jgi:type I restriction enzyme, S subunit
VKIRTYGDYTNGDQVWLGKIPTHWKLTKLKFNSYIKGRIGWQNLRSEEFIDEGPYLITGMHFDDGKVDWGACYHVSEDRYNVAPEIFVKERDVLITKDGTIGKVAFVRELPGKATLNSHLLLIRPLNETGYHPRFLYHLLASETFQDFAALEQKGTTFNGITQECVENFSMLCPPLHEQLAIANFLDRETARIDALIEKKQRQIELLQEKATALISHAVTKGLDPSVRMKDSGVASLGQIPEHWEVKRVKHLAKMVSKGTTPTTLGVDFRDSGIRFIKVENIVDGKIEDRPAIFIDEETNRLLKRSILKVGDVLIVIAGATTGKVAVVTGEHLPANTNQAVSFIRPRNSGVSRFLFYSLSGRFIQQQIWLDAVQSAQPNLSMEDITNFLIPTPPFKEIVSLVQFIDRKCQEIDNIIQKVTATVDILQEYRTAVISAAVTGKIDVREEPV